MRRAGLLATDPARTVRRARNYRRTTLASSDGEEWSLRPLAALDFALLQHFTTLRGVRGELAAAGFEPIVIYESEFLDFSWPAVEVPATASSSTAGGFHVVARRLGAAS